MIRKVIRLWKWSAYATVFGLQLAIILALLAL